MKISVAMCTYNGERYLREQLDSIASQTLLPDELIVCDDQSVDATHQIVADFAAQAPFPVRVLINETNLGSTRNFERAIGLAAGDVVALCDQDDIWLSKKLERLAAEFAANPKVGLVFSDGDAIDENGEELGYTIWEKLPFNRIERERMERGQALDQLLPGATVTGATMAFRSHLRELFLPIPNDLPLIHDAWIALLIAAVAKVVPVSEPLIKYRQHEDQQVGARERMQDPARLGSIKKAMRSPTSYAEMIETITRVRQRLMAHSAIFNSDAALAALEPRLKHLQARERLPSGILGRARCVLTELLAWRYHRYANGLRSAVKDLLG